MSLLAWMTRADLADSLVCSSRSSVRPFVHLNGSPLSISALCCRAAIVHGIWLRLVYATEPQYPPAHPTLRSGGADCGLQCGLVPRAASFDGPHCALRLSGTAPVQLASIQTRGSAPCSEELLVMDLVEETTDCASVARGKA